MTTGETLAVTEASQIGQARRAALRLAELSKFTEEVRGEVAIVTTELATNLVRYGRDGRLFLQAVERPDDTHVQILAIDSGPGISDVQQSLQDGVSAGGTPGTGLGAVRRISDEFDIYSTMGNGTLVLSRVRCGPEKRRKANVFQWAAMSTPAPHETVCGDAWCLVEHDGGLAVMLADGLGHGPLAAEASQRAADLFNGESWTPAAFCESAHVALAGTRGAALAMAHVSASGRIRYAGVGNIAGSIVGAKTQGLPSQNGTVGLNVRRVREFEYEWPDRGVLVMHSDGLTSRWSLDSHQGLASRHPSIIAGVLYRDCLRGRDDATVVVAKKTVAITR